MRKDLTDVCRRCCIYNTLSRLTCNIIRNVNPFFLLLLLFDGGGFCESRYIVAYTAAAQIKKKVNKKRDDLCKYRLDDAKGAASSYSEIGSQS